jgi:hypothetical protein
MSSNINKKNISQYDKKEKPIMKNIYIELVKLIIYMTIIIVGGVYTYIHFFQNDIFFESSNKKEYNSKTISYGYYIEEKNIATTNMINYLYIKNKESSINNRLIVVVHDINDDIYSSLYQYNWLIDLGFDVVIFDYSGFGKSKGQKNIGSNFNDLNVVFNTVAERYNKKFYVFAQGYGSTLYLNYLATNHNKNIIKSVVESPYYDLGTILKYNIKNNEFLFPFSSLSSMFSYSQYEINKEKVSSIDSDVLLISSINDKITDIENLDNIKESKIKIVPSTEPFLMSMNDIRIRKNIINFILAY